MVGSIILLAAVSLASSAVWVLRDLTLPPESGTRWLPGLAAPVTVQFDPHGIPFIRASGERDAAEALGYLHARDRLLQMDLMRRAAGGTLAALIGPSGLSLDRTMRVLGTGTAADQAYAALPVRTKTLLIAYARGVNAYIDQAGRLASPEYLFLGRPAPWRPTDCLLWAETMGLALSGNLDLELARLALRPRLSIDAILALWPNGPAAEAPPAEHAENSGVGAALARLAGATRLAMPQFPAPFTFPAQASNEWALDGHHTATGAPMLAGDPHLSYGLPALWYLTRIDTPTGTLAGATAPGVPFIVIGRNRRIAWTFTTAAADTEEIFVERVLDHGHYQGPHGPLPFEIRQERIQVRGRPDVLLSVRTTRHGPVISDLGQRWSEGVSSGDVLAASVASLMPGNGAASGLESLDDASNLDDAERAAVSLTAPVQNLLVADRHEIGLFTTGRVPIRSPGDNGRFPVSGWSDAHDWTGWASGSALPTIRNPASGLIVNANEPMVGSPGGMTGDPFGSWRADRIRAVLTKLPHPATEADFARLQLDVASAYISVLLPVLRSTTPRDDLSRQALALLDGWTGTMSVEAPQPLIAEAWLSELEQALAAAAGDPGESATDTLDFTAATLLASKAKTRWRPLFSRTLASSTHRVAARWGEEPRQWRWGEAHHAVFENVLWQRIPVLGWLRQATPAVGGDDSTVDVQSAVPARDDASFHALHGAAFRGVYDLADLDRSRFVISTGESGNVFSDHLLDLTETWQHGGSVRLGPHPDHITGRLELRPSEAAQIRG